MDRPTISIKLLKEDNHIIQYAYEGKLVADFSYAGIIEFHMKTLKEFENDPIRNDYTMLSIQSFLTHKLNVIKVCEYPLYSEIGEDYCAIYAFAYIIERFFETNQLPQKIYCLNKKDVQFLEQNGDINEIIRYAQVKSN